MPDLATTPGVSKYCCHGLRLTFLYEFVGELALAAKSRAFQGQSFFCLRIECRVFDGRVDEDPHMVFDLKWFDRSCLVLLFDLIETVQVSISCKNMPMWFYSLFASCVASISTCVPPLVVAMELAKETCCICPSDKANATSHRLFTTSYIRGAFEIAAPPVSSEADWLEAFRYISTYCLRQLAANARVQINLPA